MVARMVRDHKVVGSNPVASTKKAGEQRLACLFEFLRGKKRDSRGGGVLREQNGLRRETGCRDKKSRKLNGAVHRSPGRVR